MDLISMYNRINPSYFRFGFIIDPGDRIRFTFSRPGGVWFEETITSVQEDHISTIGDSGDIFSVAFIDIVGFEVLRDGATVFIHGNI